MPLSVPLKTSRTGSKGGPYPHGSPAHAAVQAAAQLAARSGAQVDWTTPASSSRAPAGVPPSVTAPPAIPPATGSVWGHGVSASSISAKQAAAYKPFGLKHNTPQAVLRSFYEHEREREAKHWDSKGTQIVSSRATCPSASFHNGPSGRVVEEKSRCREIGEHPNLENPGPECYTIEPIHCVCMVPTGWSREDRFKGSLFETKDTNALGVKMSSGAHPLCPTYPYPEPDLRVPRSPSLQDGEGGDLAAGTDDHANHAKEGGKFKLPLQLPTDEENRRNPIRTADLNHQYFKFKHKPAKGFGSSGLGCRFNPGTAFAKQPTNKPHKRLLGFRELRESIPERSEKGYQDALEKALVDAAADAAAATAATLSSKPSQQPPPSSTPSAAPMLVPAPAAPPPARQRSSQAESGQMSLNQSNNAPPEISAAPLSNSNSAAAIEAASVSEPLDSTLENLPGISHS